MAFNAVSGQQSFKTCLLKEKQTKEKERVPLYLLFSLLVDTNNLGPIYVFVIVP